MTVIIYTISQMGKELHQSLAKHIQVSDSHGEVPLPYHILDYFVNAPEGLTIGSVRLQFGEFGCDVFKALHRQGYFAAGEYRKV